MMIISEVGGNRVRHFEGRRWHLKMARQPESIQANFCPFDVMN